MSQKHLNRRDAETIMIALDQVSQTIDVLDGVVNRLKLYVQTRLDQDEPRLRSPAPAAATGAEKTGEHEAIKDLPIH